MSVVAQAIADSVTSDNVHSVSSKAVAEAISFSENEHQVGYWIDGSKLYERTLVFQVPANGDYSPSVPSGIKVKDWRGNFFQGTVDNPAWIMHIPYTYLNLSDNKWLNIYVYFNPAGNRFECTFNGTYSSQYFNGYAVITYRYTKS